MINNEKIKFELCKKYYNLVSSDMDIEVNNYIGD